MDVAWHVILAKLRHALEIQLVGQYFLNPGLHYGALVLANGRTSQGSARSFWQRSGGVRLSFKEFVNDLHGVALDIPNDSREVDSLDVVGLDFN